MEFHVLDFMLGKVDQILTDIDMLKSNRNVQWFIQVEGGKPSITAHAIVVKSLE